jgi:hypothetical protein
LEERRKTVRRLFGQLRGPLGLALLLGGAAAGACELPPGVRIESERLVISYWTKPAKIAVGEPFVLELAACPKGAARLPERVRLDAHMPEHRHGMNYRTKVVPLATGRYHSEGWLFHMPGRWEFVFDLGAERLTHSVRVE